MNMFKTFSLITACFLVFTLILTTQPGIAKPVSLDTEPEQSIISVSGSADVMVVPDEAVITLGIDTRDKDISKAKAQNDERVNKIMELAKRLNIESKHIKVDYINIKPGDISAKPEYNYSYDEVSTENRGYVVRKSIVVTLKDLTKFEEFLTEVVKNGAEYVQSVQFKTSELRKHKDKARELAVKAAREKADAMTSVLGQKAGKAVSIREEQEYYWSWYDSWYSGWYGGSAINASNYVQNVVSSVEPQNSEGIEPGQIRVNARVSVDFILQ
ncbi:MAG: SIMPL domain-containing protein [Clostridiaceae bacterium]|nr:SIMPL domain-containing protein [Clostridiaceae bacterium]